MVTLFSYFTMPIPTKYHWITGWKGPVEAIWSNPLLAVALSFVTSCICGLTRLPLGVTIRAGVVFHSLTSYLPAHPTFVDTRMCFFGAKPPGWHLLYHLGILEAFSSTISFLSPMARLLHWASSSEMENNTKWRAQAPFYHCRAWCWYAPGHDGTSLPHHAQAYYEDFMWQMWLPLYSLHFGREEILRLWTWIVSCQLGSEKRIVSKLFFCCTEISRMIPEKATLFFCDVALKK